MSCFREIEIFGEKVKTNSVSVSNPVAQAVEEARFGGSACLPHWWHGLGGASRFVDASKLASKQQKAKEN
jgi:hypothetical protein